MIYLYRHLFTAMWLSWALYWLASARNVKVAARREPLASRVLHLGPLALGLFLLWIPRLPVPVLGSRLVPWAAWQFWTGALLTASGLLFTVWARQHIGKNFSFIVTLKESHELVTSGPYALVRHPMYTGLLIAFIGSAIARDEWRGVFAVALASWALWRKLRIEEHWLGEQFGEAYQAYRRRVASLVPFVF